VVFDADAGRDLHRHHLALLPPAAEAMPEYLNAFLRPFGMRS
jgi:hypothetical protein